MRGIRPLFRRPFDAVHIRPRQSLVHAGRKRPLSSAAGVATCQLHPPPFDLPAPYFERPTPILLVQGEGCGASGAASWGSMVPFLNSRGCSVGTLDYGPALPSASLAELEQGIVSAVRALAAGPPVIIAHSAMSFIAQKFLESHAARGMILLDPFPPSPAARASRLLTELHKTSPESSSTTIPWKALEQMRDPANAVKLEPGAVPMLLVYTRKAAMDGEHEERQAMATFHAVDPEDVHTLALPLHHVAGDGQGTQRPPTWAVLSEAVDAGFNTMAYDWYDERF